MKYLIPVLLLFLVSCGSDCRECSEVSGIDLNKLNALKFQNSKWSQGDQMYTGYIKRCKTGKLRSYFYVDYGDMQGKSEEYDEYGNVTKYTQYAGGKEQGERRSYSDGVLTGTTEFDKGIRHGDAYHYINGQLASISTYNNGKVEYKKTYSFSVKPNRLLEEYRYNPETNEEIWQKYHLENGDTVCHGQCELGYDYIEFKKKKGSGLSVEEIVKRAELQKEINQYETKGNWTNEYENLILENCIKGIKSSDAPVKNEDIIEICQCEIEKLKIIYPDINERYDPNVLMEIEEECALWLLSKYQ